jgi:c-di-GMP-binding flagellar brake protein YcgR
MSPSSPAPAPYQARRSTRHAPESPTPVVDSMGERVLGFAMDLSAGGMKLLASMALVDSALYQVHFDLDLPGEGRIPLEAGMQVVNQRRTAEGNVVGLRFIHMQGTHSQRLGRWLRARGSDGRH